MLRHSIIIPAYNEAESLPELYRDLDAALELVAGRAEVIFVDDGSSDGTIEVLQELAKADSRVKVVRFVRNFGKSAAYSAGFEAAQGEFIITLDADLQDDPAEIPGMIKHLEQGYDLVIGWKQDRFGHEPNKTVPSKCFNAMVKLMFGLSLHDTNSGFRVMRRKVAASLRLQGDQYRFIPQLSHMKGFKVTECRVQHRARKYGRSKYGLTRFWTGFLDLITVRFMTGFTQKPLHFFGTIGLAPLAVGIGLEVYVLVRRLMGGQFRVHMAAIVVGVMLILVGLQLIATGLIGEMIAAQSRQGRYLIREK